MSFSIFAQFLLPDGLNFITPLHGDYQTQPAQLFVNKLEGLPPGEFYDILKVDEALWFAGNGLGSLQAGIWRRIFTEGTYTALAYDADRERVWFAGPDGIGSLETRTESPKTMTNPGAGYIWKLVLLDENLWYFGSNGYGVLNTDTGEEVFSFDDHFSPRPFVLFADKENGRIFVTALEGLYTVDERGRSLLLPVEWTDGNTVAFLFPHKEGFVLGTVDSLYRWNGDAGRPPEPIDPGTVKYGDFFENGMNNAILFRSHIAITDVPRGVLLLNRKTLEPEIYVGRGGGLEAGNIYKIAKGGIDRLIIMGEEGVAVADLNSPHRFFPSGRNWTSETVRKARRYEDGTLLIAEDSWIRISGQLLEQHNLIGMAYWFEEEPDGDPVLGYLNAYKTLRGNEWELTELQIPIDDLVWGEERAYLRGPDGLFTMTEEKAPRLVYETDRPLTLLGELWGSFYAIEDANRLLRFQIKGPNWVQEGKDLVINGAIGSVAASRERIYFTTGRDLYSIDAEGTVDEVPVQSGWRVTALASSEERLFVAFEHEVSGEQGVGTYDRSRREMLALPSLETIGAIQQLLAGDGELGVLSSNGFAQIDLRSIERAQAPDVDFDLLLGSKQIEGRTLAHGMHEIDVQSYLRGPLIAAEFQYRINEGSWRSLNLHKAMLPPLGSGQFSIELRAVYPNGQASPTKRIQFAIAPPWYMNPLYQGVLLVLFLVVVWGIYYLRHAQLKRTNQWLQNEVKKQTRELEAATAARTNFLAGLSHDIRNPLNGVLMIAETLTRDPPKSGDDSRLKDLTEFGVIVDRMLGEILDFSAIDQSNMPMAFIPVSITDILESSVKQNQFSIQKALVNISVSVPSELKEVSIKIDRNWMVKILTNLIVNALEYSESERIEVGAYCHRLTPGDVEMEIYVKDWGKGIDDAEKPFVFDRFYRGESGIESGKHGTGLGLAICQEIAHAMGAHLSLSDNTPTGSHFSLKGRFDRVSGGSELDREAVLKSLRGKHVLVVDDLLYNRRSIVDFFQAIGCHCEQSENGREALQMLDEKRYDLALLDWDLPGIMGPEIARRHRKAHPEDPVLLIALTAYTDGEKKRQSEEVGMNGYIAKPLTANRLAHCLANLEDAPVEPKTPARDAVDTRELDEEIFRHINECLQFGEAAEWENLRRCAHRLTTLALMKDNAAMQKVCRDLQVSAKAEDLKEVQVGLTELQQWRRA